MTFDAKINLQPGFPVQYLLGFILVAAAVPIYLAFKAYQSELDWIWSGLLLVISLFTVFSIFREQQKQQQYYLLIEGSAPLVLRQRCSGTDTSFTISRSDFTLQTSNIIFAKLQLDKGSTIHLVFHAFCNHPHAFRRFKVMLKMSGSSDF
ncbi:MAG: hypothetical protein L3J22_06565 [Xanthomonadales bacterium]|nr:hypothetical protein [Xanthomonadales bacterium]